MGHARDGEGRLVGYVSAFSDGAFSTFVGELVVHPKAERFGVRAALLELVRKHCGGAPMYVPLRTETVPSALTRDRAPATVSRVA